MAFLDRFHKIFDNSIEGKKTYQGQFGKTLASFRRLSQCSWCQSNLGLGLRLGTHHLFIQRLTTHFNVSTQVQVYQLYVLF